MESRVSKKIAYGGLFLAIALLLPQLFHFLPIANSGKVMLPMHIPVILAGYFLGSRVGFAVGFMSPIVSCLIFQMPAVIIMPIMAVELGVYGLAAGILGRKIKNNYVSLVGVIVLGRIASGIMYVVMINVLGVKGLNMEMFFGSLTLGIPGIILQIVVIPPIIMLMKKVDGEA